MWTLISLLFQIAILVIWGILVWRVAVKYEVRVTEYLCGRWNPRDQIVQCGPGAEFELNECKDKRAVVGWAMIKYAFYGVLIAFGAGLFVDMLVVKTILLFRGNVTWETMMLPDYWVFTALLFLVETVAAPFYWVANWRRLYTKIVGFTDGLYYTQIKESLLALLFRLPPMFSGSYTPTLEMREIFFATAGMPGQGDVAKPGFLETLWIRVFCRDRHVGEVFLPSRAFKASDLFRNFAFAANISRILRELYGQATFLRVINDEGFLKTVPKVLLGAPDKAAMSRGDAEQNLVGWTARFRNLFPPGEGQVDIVNTRRKSRWNLKTGRPRKPSKYPILTDAARAYAGKKPLSDIALSLDSSAPPAADGTPAFLA